MSEQQPPTWWFEIVEFVQHASERDAQIERDVAQRLTQIEEAIHAEHDRFEAWSKSIESDLALWRKEREAEMTFVGRNVEEALQASAKRDASGQLHKAEAAKEATAVQVAKIDNRTKIIIAVLALLQFIAGVLIGKAANP